MHRSTTLISNKSGIVALGKCFQNNIIMPDSRQPVIGFGRIRKFDKHTRKTH